MTFWIHPNLGAEEPLGTSPPPAVRCVAALFALLFPDASRRTDEPAPTRRDPELQFDPGKPAFRWLAPQQGLCAWLNDAGAAREASRLGVPLLGPDPQAVRRVHDKAFALEACRAAGHEPRSLRGLLRVFDPEELADAEGVVESVRRAVAEWPDWTGGRFCVKPRLGGSGRGRVAGRRGADLGELRRALPRLARQGGAVLEPWLERERDFSIQLHVADDGTLTLLASFELSVSSSGVYRGHRGRLDHRLRAASGHEQDAAAFEPACAVARAAHAHGFRGPCSVDAFRFRGEHGSELRSVVELNARFTTGTIVAGLLRLARRQIQRRVAAEPGETRSFEFSLAPRESDDPGVFCLQLGPLAPGFSPRLVVRREPASQPAG